MLSKFFTLSSLIHSVVLIILFSKDKLFTLQFWLVVSLLALAALLEYKRGYKDAIDRLKESYFKG